MSWERCTLGWPFALEDGGYLPARQARPCYPGGTYLGRGWSWLWECHQWGGPILHPRRGAPEFHPELVACTGLHREAWEAWVTSLDESWRMPLVHQLEAMFPHCCA